MHGSELLLLLAGSLAVTAIARRFDWPAPLLLVAVGLGLSFVPGMPDFRLDPELVLPLVLPPLLYSAALDSSYVNIRRSVRPIGLLAVGLVLATTLVVGLATYWLVPGMPLAAALVLGAIVAPPDAVAAVAIGRKLGLPRRIMTVLIGESLVNDATALTAYKVAVASATGLALSWSEGIGTFLLASVGGGLIGYLLGVLVHAVRQRLSDSVLESALGMLVPFGAYLIAESAHTSGVLAVVAAGLYLGHNAPRAGYATRLQETAVWRAFDVLLESWVFALIGLQVRLVYRESGVTWPLLLAALGVLAVAVLIRVVWMFPGTYLPRLLSKRIRENEEDPGWRSVSVVAWAGMRGVVSLAAAAALPESMPERNVIVLFTFVVTVGTLLLQGLSLPWVIRKLGVESNEEHTDTLAEAQVKYHAARASIDRLDQEAADSGTPEQVVARLRTIAEHRGNAAWERLGRSEEEIGESPASRWRRLRRTMLAAEREVFLAARNAREIDDEVFRRVQRELDLEEAALNRE
ncbi:Na+/H+ antiporter [Kutzneria viridogrisea]|uniref:CPA1 family monovalent cation:H+ antiporter n=1 Tax=Kutzneria viridogrisea TaxID=47990 RepID=A0ABR6BS59_9PSEU|nr:CPA1 family monovalent cation:H+ antiporter [Kutzneria viridogrisea]